MIVLLCLPVITAQAQFDLDVGAGKEGEITSAPLCTQLINRSKQEIMGTISTAPQALNSGDVAPMRENFKLSPDEKKDVCTTGPFLAGRKINLILRTIIPLFECETALTGPIYLDVVTTDSGFRTLSATCH